MYILLAVLHKRGLTLLAVGGLYFGGMIGSY